MSSAIIKQASIEAGIMNFDEATKKVTSDKRKGLIKITCTAEGEKTFSWSAEGQPEPEFEYAVLQDDAKFEFSKQMKKVLVLRFECDTSRYFFWIQGKDEASNNQKVKQIQEIIDWDIDSIMVEEPDVPASHPSNANPASVPSVAASQTVSQPLQNPRTRPQQATNPTQLNSQLQSLLNSFSQQNLGNQRNNNNLQEYYQQLGRRVKETPGLNEVFTKESLAEISHDEEAKKQLIDLLPQGQNTETGLEENLHSPQFQQAMEQLEHVLNSEEGGAVLVSLGLDSLEYQSTLDGVQSFYSSLIKQAEQQKKPEDK